MPQRTHDPYPFRVNCAATACAPISSVLRAIPARHRILESAVNQVEDFRRPIELMLEGRRIRARLAVRKETVKRVCCIANGNGSDARCESENQVAWKVSGPL
jgi:hypothetical protein